MTLLSSYFRMDYFSGVMAGFCALFYVLTAVYSISFRRGKPNNGAYQLYLLLTFLSALGVLFARQWIVFLILWGFLGVLLYLLINFGEKPETSAAAKKALIIVGGSDALMILGVALIFQHTGTLEMSGAPLLATTPWAGAAFVLLACGAFAKAGAMPFHTWVPDMAAGAPIPATAYLPASLDKLLGIYLLARLIRNIFVLSPALHTFLLVIGSLTIVAAVMMALIQHDLKKLLGYHAVSQVGYMVLGLGTGNAVGMAGGLFHMINHTLYKSCLFLSGGAVEKREGTTDLDKLGGLFRSMPWAGLCFLVGSLAISGVPPLNGFASKWMIYQGLLERGRDGDTLWILWLIAAMFGSALTLASFMKVFHAVFLGMPSSKDAPTKVLKKEDALLTIPLVLLAFLCLLFGVLAGPLPLRKLIYPSLHLPVETSGTWQPAMAATLLGGGLFIGLVIFLVGAFKKTRETDSFVGGENLDEHPEMRMSGVEFYKGIQDMPGLKSIYRRAEEKEFDPYNGGISLTGRVTRILKYLHNGVLPTYLAWVLLGAGLLLIFLMR